MTPFRGRRRNTGRKLKRKGIQLKKKQGRPRNEEPSSPKYCKKPYAIDGESSKLEVFNGCCTPRGERYRIPEISTCPRTKNEEPSSPKSCKNPDAIDGESSKLEVCYGCCTPRGERYRKTEISTCPMPKKEEPSSPKSCKNQDAIDGESSKLEVCNGLCTPRAEKYRIPEISTCPPAPMKKRRLSSIFSLKRSPVSFFSPPDLDLFFSSIPNLSA